MKNNVQKSVLVACLFLIAASFSYAQKQQTKPVKPPSKTMQPVAPIEPSKPVHTNGSDFRMPAGGGLSEAWSHPSGDLKFYTLPYGYDALEPVIDKLTVEIHYDRHHRAYYTNFEKAIAETGLSKLPIYTIFEKVSDMSDVIRNNAGGYFNHVLYWENLSPKGGGQPSEKLGNVIVKHFGSFEKFVQKFNEAAKSRFGSGWAWLSVDPSSGELFITSTANQDNPLMVGIGLRNGVPILALDVWEHAYYLKYQNKRADYIEAFWKIVDWNVVEKRFEQALIK